MGRTCAWCGSLIRHGLGSAVPVSHGLCGGCLQDLSAALQREELALREAPPAAPLSR